MADPPIRRILRRLVRAIARGEPITQHVSTLENPAIVEQLRGGRRSGFSRDQAGLRALNPGYHPAI